MIFLETDDSETEQTIDEESLGVDYDEIRTKDNQSSPDDFRHEVIKSEDTDIKHDPSSSDHTSRHSNELDQTALSREDDNKEKDEL